MANALGQRSCRRLRWLSLPHLLRLRAWAVDHLDYFATHADQGWATVEAGVMADFIVEATEELDRRAGIAQAVATAGLIRGAA
jgi:hypothetical protein